MATARDQDKAFEQANAFARAQAQAEKQASAERARSQAKKKAASEASREVAPLDDLPLPPPGYVRFRTLDDEIRVVAELTAPVLPQGGGGHSTQERPKAVGVLTWDGTTPTVLPFELILDEWPNGSIATELRNLRTLCGVGETEPVPFVIEGIGIPYSRAQRPSWTWVFGAPSWGEHRFSQARPNESGLQALTVEATHNTRPSAAATSAATKRRFHTVHPKARINTLREIGEFYKVSWPRLLQLNPKLPRDVNRPLKAGTRVQLS
jgi:hypothetical protein